jgi:hypothetical protein
MTSARRPRWNWIENLGSIGRRLGLRGAGAVARPSRAGRLAELAGQCAGQRMDALEPRQLLFALSISPGDVNPVTGLGTVTAEFAYVLPYVLSPTITPRPALNVIEDFNDEQAFWATQNPPIPPVGTFLEGSSFQVSYTGGALVALDPANAQPGSPRRLRIQLQGNDTSSFQFFTDDQGGGGRFVRVATSVSFIGGSLLPGGSGLNTAANGTRVQLLREGNVVASFSGAALAALAVPAGGGAFTYTIPFAPGFDGVRFNSALGAPDNATYEDRFFIDNLTASFPGGTYAAFMEQRIQGAWVTFTGRVGATVEFFNLYNEPMRRTFALGLPPSSQVTLVDANDDGIPDFNDGLGRVVISGGDADTSLTLLGGVVTTDQDGFVLEQIQQIEGRLSDFEQIGFGHTITNDDTPRATGLPSAGAGMMIGSPIVRDRTSQTTYLRAPQFSGIGFFDQNDFNRVDQGIFVDDGSTVGNITVHALLYGQTRFTGAVQRLGLGVLQGSVRIEGDLGVMKIASDAGVWSADNRLTAVATPASNTNSSQSQIFVGRTAREISVGGRNYASITVVGDINNPSRRALQQVDFFESERVYRLLATGNPTQATLSVHGSPFISGDPLGKFGGNGQAMFFGGGFSRNDDLMSAEFVGYNGTAVRISGQLNGGDPINTALDRTDVYAFAADSTREVVVQTGFGGPYIRIVDRDGRVVAAQDFGGAGRGPQGNFGGGVSQVLRFRPDVADVYYLVVGTNVATQLGFSPYSVSLAGMAPVTLGMLRSVGGAGTAAIIGGDFPVGTFSLNVSSGSTGSVRIGTGTVQSSGDVAGPTSNTHLGTRGQLAWGASTVNVAGNLFNVVAGADFTGAQIIVGRSLGTVVTAASALTGRGPTIGDLYSADIRVGRDIGLLDISGSISAFDTPTGPQGGGATSIRTGLAGGSGSIGQVLVGNRVFAPTFSLQIPTNGVVDQFLVGPGAGIYAGEVYGGLPNFRSGIGADVRFVDFTRVWRDNSLDVVTRVTSTTPQTFVDDSGAALTVSIEGGDAGSFSTVDVRVLPVNGSRGVAIARISGTLNGGASLVLRGADAGVISVGRIILTVADSGAGRSDIVMAGPTQIDVGRIDIIGAARDIRNETPSGDIVAIDANSIRGSIVITSGSLGRTQVSGVGSSRLGPFLGIQGQRGSNAVGSGLGVDPVTINNGIAKWNGQDIFTPIELAEGDPNAGPLEDNGSPIDGRLDGVVVRSGDLRSVRVAGGVGDVIVEGGDLLSVVVNSDGVTPAGSYDGVFGSVFAVSIGVMDVGDGLQGTGPSPFARAGIFAEDDIVTIQATRIRGATISGVITAFDLVTAFRSTIGTEEPVNLATGFTGGIQRVTLLNASMDDAYISTDVLDGFWTTFRPGRFEDTFYRDNISTVDVTNGNIFRSVIRAVGTDSIRITNGVWDASLGDFSGDVGPIFADEFRNTTRIGPPAEFRTSRIRTGGDISTVQTNGLNGDFSDFTIDASGRITGGVSGRNFDRVNILVPNAVREILATQDFRASEISVGSLTLLDVRGSVRTSTIRAAGPISRIIVGDEMTATRIASTGPDGQIGRLQTQNRMQVSVVSDGRINTVESIAGDIEASIETTDATDGNITLIRAGDELLLDLQIRGDVGTIQSARNIGRLTDPKDRSLDIRGNLGSVIAGGQIYSDILVGQSITGSVTNAAVSAKAGADFVSRADIIAFGRINALNLFGDVNGNIVSYSGGIGTVTITSGSLRQGRRIQSFDGNIDNVTFLGGDLLGSVVADGDIGRIDVLVGPDGFVGHIGVANGKRDDVSAGTLRNQLPPGVQRTNGIDGASIRARGSIGVVNVSRGAIWESTIWAGLRIQSIVAPAIRNDSLTTVPGSGIGAGDRIESLSVRNLVSRTQVVSGLVSLGADNRVGGTGASADTVKSGTIGTVVFGRTNNTTFSAGITAGSNGLYNQTDSRRAPGVSGINNITVVSPINVSAFSDGRIGFATPGVVRTIGGLGQVDPSRVAGAVAGEVQLPAGAAFSFTTTSGERGTATFSGPGRAFWSAANNRIRLQGANAGSALNVASSGGTLTDFSVLGANNMRLGSVVVSASLLGNSRVYVDGAVSNMALSRVDSSGGLFGSGENVASFSSAAFLGGTLIARTISSMTVNGEFGRGNGLAAVRLIDAGTVNISGRLAGAFSADRTIGSFTAGGIARGGVRAGFGITTVTINGSTELARISAGDFLTNVTVNGSTDETVISAGGDFGTDANFGGSGSASDRLSNGTIGSVNVTGNFVRSDVTAGVLRGPSGFVGGDDVSAADGRSQVGTVTIGGNTVGSTLFTQQYRVASTGTVGNVQVAGQPFETRGNFSIREFTASPVPVLVDRLEVSQESLVYTVRVFFNNPINASTLSGALSVGELRNSGATVIGLAEGSDYTVRYDAVNRAAVITFSQAITARNLPQIPGVPGPGVYQIRLSAAVLRGESQLSLLDGNRDGIAGDDFFGNTVVGDAGDKIVAANPTGNPSIDFYGATDLDLVLNSNNNPSNLPQSNTPFSVRGFMGDHPDANSTDFRFGGDVDVYRLTLRAGQILRLSEIRGAAFQASRGLYNAAGELITGRPGSGLVTLPATTATNTAESLATPEQQLLVTVTGTYYLVLSAGFAGQFDINDGNQIPNVVAENATLGFYEFTLTIFDDQNSGFIGDTASGIGASVVNAPTPITFAGPDGRFGTADDLRVFVTGDYRFTLDQGPDGRPNTRDDTVRGGNGKGGIVSTRTAGADGRFGTADDVLTSTASAAIGLPSAVGAPFEITPDVDVFRLNGGQPIQPGTRVRATLKLTANGGNLGFAQETANENSRFNFFSRDLGGAVQFALFELPAGTDFDNAKLVAAPSDFLGIGARAPESSSSGGNTYGYDANGDFFMEFVIPGAQGVAGTPVPGVYALYVQGAIRSDYALEIVSTGGVTQTPQRQTQNLVLETRGGVVSWLQAGRGVTTRLDAFNAGALGFSGLIGGVDVDTYIINNLVASLNSLFTDANVDVRISSSPIAFEGQDYSTVFLAGNAEPSAFFNDGEFGASEQSDAFNADKNDEAVVFVPALNTLVGEPTQAGVDALVRSLTAAVARRVGELTGLRFTANVGTPTNPIPVTAVDSVGFGTSGSAVYAFANTDRRLASSFDLPTPPGLNNNVFFSFFASSLLAADTDFFLGVQNDAQLLRTFLAPRS